MKILDGLRNRCIGDGNLQIGRIKGCLEFLGVDMSAGWLAGGTGNAFLIAMGGRAGICDVYYALDPAPDREAQVRLGRNVGYELAYNLAGPEDPELADTRAKAVSEVRHAIDSGLPCYGWYGRDYHTICGYDEAGEFYFAPGETWGGGEPWVAAGWEDMGTVMEFYLVRPGQPADDRTTVREGIEYAIEYAHRDTTGGDSHGLQAFDNWIETMEAKETGVMQRHAPAWSGLRDLAVDFLAEAKQRLGGDAADLFDEAREPYQVVAENLRPLRERFTIPRMAENKEAIEDDAIRAEIVAHLEAARAAEAEGLKALERIAEALR